MEEEEGPEEEEEEDDDTEEEDDPEQRCCCSRKTPEEEEKDEEEGGRKCCGPNQYAALPNKKDKGHPPSERAFCQCRVFPKEYSCCYFWTIKPKSYKTKLILCPICAIRYVINCIVCGFGNYCYMKCLGEVIVILIILIIVLWIRSTSPGYVAVDTGEGLGGVANDITNGGGSVIIISPSNSPTVSPTLVLASGSPSA